MYGKETSMAGNGNNGNGNGESTPELSDAELIDLIRQTVEQHGCTLVDIDLENQVLNIDGPEEDKVECALALGRLLGE
jgi:hypothetical protein